MLGFIDFSAFARLARAGAAFVCAALFLPMAHSQVAPRDVPTFGPQAAALRELVAEALKNNPELKASLSEKEAARHRVAPAGALDDPMLEAGVLNAPVSGSVFRKEDMTMKMLGISQKLPSPGKRALRQEVAAKDAEAVEQGYRETSNRVARDVKLAYFDLGLATETARLITENTRVLEQFLRIAESRYSVGQGTQADVLKAQTQLAKMSEELLRVQREIPVAEAELARLLGRTGTGAPIGAALPPLRDADLDLAALREAALRQRPQLIGLRTLIDKGNTALDLARKESSPDFDLRLSYGQRDKAPDGMPRTDLFSVTVAMNLPVWGADKTEPRISEAVAMRDQAMNLYQAQQNELVAKLRQQIAIAEQSRRSAGLYDTAILPQARLAVDSALASYRVSRADLLALLDSQMNLFNYGIGRAAAVANFNKALAELNLLTGAEPL
jgi:cobalt-zinc-cadmium efflux system outer membrane protein